MGQANRVYVTHATGHQHLLETTARANDEHDRSRRRQARSCPTFEPEPQTVPLPVLDEQGHLGLLLVSQLRIGTWIELQEDDFIQGYLLSRPVPCEALPDILQQLDNRP